ncbi:aspartate/glutamate racemase family protein [Salipiger mangrovisoli]|uniref:Aspartate/glutamate racemase family protein n=1 Tax=Salipiger mangrovisoli TaxID=2865933 RepID=A0ABR9WZX8_9RHOB|nr:aspartate/glutamate racemase family protein [Salipiger mangrovisoli]MBE9636813.1 aspartate/glutamate racemase family protein [Salipiger mangrovisoli]
MSAFIGILSLDTRFPRILGDAGNPGSYHLPARLRIVPGAGSPDIVRDGRPAPALVAGFQDAAAALVAEGACLITSTCGFLITVQQEVASTLPVPVLLSGLCLLPVVSLMTGGRPVGVLTASETALGPAAIRAAGALPEKVRIGGLQDSTLFAGTFLAAKSEQRAGFDPLEMQHEVCAAAERLVTRAPEIAAIVLECGNLPPYAEAIRRATGRPVFSILDAARLVTAA